MEVDFTGRTGVIQLGEIDWVAFLKVESEDAQESANGKNSADQEAECGPFKALILQLRNAPNDEHEYSGWE